MEPKSAGLLLIAGGGLIALLGLLVYSGGFSWFGKLPGDVRYEGESTRVFVPITSMILVSVLLTLVLSVIRRFF